MIPARWLNQFISDNLINLRGIGPISVIKCCSLEIKLPISLLIGWPRDFPQSCRSLHTGRRSMLGGSLKMSSIRGKNICRSSRHSTTKNHCSSRKAMANTCSTMRGANISICVQAYRLSIVDILIPELQKWCRIRCLNCVIFHLFSYSSTRETIVRS